MNASLRPAEIAASFARLRARSLATARQFTWERTVQETLKAYFQ